MRWGLANSLPRLASTTIHPISASQIGSQVGTWLQSSF
jgi:hypothetical protein